MSKFETNRLNAKHCPCGKSNKDGKFVPYKGYENKGFCHACSTTFPIEKDTVVDQKETKVVKQIYVSEKTKADTMKCYNINSFVKAFQFDKGIINKWNLGTAKDGSVIFWLVNEHGKICSGKKVLYQENGKRNKSRYPSHIFKRDEGYFPCLFGLHLMKPNSIVCLVESEKSAIIASLHYPNYTWIATGGASGFTRQKAIALSGRTVKLFIDCDNAGRKSSEKTISILNSIKCKVELIDIDKSLDDGSDIADFILSGNKSKVDCFLCIIKDSVSHYEAGRIIYRKRTPNDISIADLEEQGKQI